MTDVAPVCAQCAAENTPGSRFCSACGAPLGPAAPAREERKVVTVLFADLVGFTARSERLDPEDVRAMLGPYYGRVRADLERYGGTVEKFIGDAVMAIFGAPVAHEDDPERAVRAAIAIRQAIRELNEADPGLELQLRVGVNTGEALVALGARIGEGEGMVAGDIVNTAARMQMAAPVNGILVGEMTYRATERAIEYRAAEPVQAKGKTDPIKVWEAVQARSAFGVDVAPRRGTALVGRADEMNLLTDALARVRRERTSQLVTLVGVPGIGKSRLLWELFDAVEADPDLIYWRQGRSLPYGEGVSFWALGEMAKAHAGILETDTAGEAEAKLRQAVVSRIESEPEAQWVTGHLRPLVGLGAEQELTGDRRSEAFAAWRRFFESLAEERPLVLVFEDLHWADEGLLDFIDYLVDWASGVPLLTVCTARPELLERRPDWGGGKRNAVTVSLSPLSEEDTARLVSALLEQAVLPADTQSALLAHAGGNPLYAEEYIRMLQDRGFLRRVGSAWHLEKTEQLPLPESVQGIIAARLDALSPEEKALLQDAAVAGKVAWVGALSTISDTPRWEVEERLHGLERKEFLTRDRRSSVAGETQYVFRHVLVRDVAYNQIPRADRVEKHRAAAEWLESLPKDRSEDRAEMLAHHYASALELAQATGKDAGPLAERARLALREAGDRAAALNAFDAAARFYQRAVELTPDPGPHLLLAYGRSLSWASSTGGDVLEQARAGLVELGEREAAAEAETLLGELYWLQGQRDQASEHLRNAAELIEDAPVSFSKAYVLAEVSRFHMLASEDEQAIAVGGEALEMAEQLGLDELRANALNNIGIARTLKGDLAGLEDLEASIEIAESINSPESIRGYGNLASILGNVGELDRAWKTLAQARGAAERFGFAEPLRWQTNEQVGEWYYTARWTEALELADRLIAEAEESVHWMEPVLRRLRAQMRMARGDVRGAVDDAERAVEFVRVATDPQLVYPVLATAARIYCAAGRSQEAAALLDELLVPRAEGRGYVDSEWTADAAVALGELRRRGDLQPARTPPTRWLRAARAYLAGDFQDAAARYAQIGSQPDEAYSRLRAAESLITAGHRADGERELRRAVAFYREVGATRYIGEAEALLAASA